MTRITGSPYLASLLSLFIAACAASVDGPDVFPPAGALDAARKARVVQARTTGIHTLTAVLAIEFSGFERRGTFDMVVNYDDSGHLRFSAFKDLFISTRPVFDLLLTQETYRLEVYDAGQARRAQGDVSQFARRHPQFRAFYTIGEGFFLPGFDAAGRPPALTHRAATAFVTRLKSGAVARWSAKAETLEITSARIETFSIQYGDYRQIGPYYIPGLVVITDASQGTTSRGVLKHVDINTPLAPGVFDLSSAPGRPWLHAVSTAPLVPAHELAPQRRNTTGFYD